MRSFLTIAGCIAVVLCLTVPAIPINAKDQGAGKRFAETYCAKCHAIGPTGASPHAKAPPFRVIAARENIDDLQEAFAEGIVVGHEAMPEFELQPDQIAELLAFLKSLSSAH